MTGCSGGTTPASTGTSTTTTTTTQTQAAPVASTISPSTAVGGSAGFTLTVTGQNFISSSVVAWNGAAVTSTYVSATQLTASIPAAYIAASGTANVSVLDPAPLSLTSGVLNFSITAPPPAISSLSPSSVSVGSGDITLMVTGTGFVSGSVVQAGSTALSTSFVSATTLRAVLPSTLLSSVGSLNVTVVNPAPNAATSAAANFAVAALPAPAITALAPQNAIVGSGATTLAITGTNFLTGSVVQAGSTPLTTTYVSPTSLRATLPANLLGSIGSLSITVANPAPSAATSAASVFAVIAQPPPSITTLSPASVTAGAPAFTLSVTGQYITTGSVLQFNGQTLTPSSQTSTSLTVSVPDTLIATAGSYPVTIISPGSGAGSLTSAAATFNVTALPAGTFIVGQTVNDLVADPVRPLLYGSVPSTATQNGNKVVVMDPTTGTITKSVSVGSEPNRIAISGDGKYLYVALDGASSVVRLLLPDLTTDFTVSLGADSFFGANTALDLSVAPGNSGVWAVTSGSVGVSPAAQKGVQVYDNAIPRGSSVGRNSAHGGFDLLLGTIVWGADTTVLYGANNESTGFDLYVLPILASGVGTIVDYGSRMPGFNNLHIHYDPTTQLVYGDSGYVVDPATGKTAGQFAYSGPMVPDGGLNAAFFVGSGTSSTLTMTSFDLTKYTPLNTYTVPAISGTPNRLVRWGSNGVAFNTLSSNYTGTTSVKTGKVFIYAGSFVKP